MPLEKFGNTESPIKASENNATITNWHELFSIDHYSEESESNDLPATKDAGHSPTDADVPPLDISDPWFPNKGVVEGLDKQPENSLAPSSSREDRISPVTTEVYSRPYADSKPYDQTRETWEDEDFEYWKSTINRGGTPKEGTSQSTLSKTSFTKFYLDPVSNRLKWLLDNSPEGRQQERETSNHITDNQQQKTSPVEHEQQQGFEQPENSLAPSSPREDRISPVTTEVYSRPYADSKSYDQTMEIVEYEGWEYWKNTINRGGTPKEGLFQSPRAKTDFTKFYLDPVSNRLKWLLDNSPEGRQQEHETSNHITDNQQQKTSPVEHEQQQGFEGSENPTTTASITDWQDLDYGHFEPANTQAPKPEDTDTFIDPMANSWLPENTRGYNDVYDPKAYSPFAESAFTSPNQPRVEVNQTNRAAKLSSLSFRSEGNELRPNEVGRNPQPEQETREERKAMLDRFQGRVKAFDKSSEGTGKDLSDIIDDWNNYQRGKGVRNVYRFKTLETAVQREIDKLEGNVKIPETVTRSPSFKEWDDRNRDGTAFKLPREESPNNKFLQKFWKAWKK